MITKLTVESFKTLEKVEVDLGVVNVFVGANGSGKSNLLEAVGVLAAAADGKVDDKVLLQRGVRPGVPELYKSAFNEKLPQHQLRGFAVESAQGHPALAFQDGMADPRWKEAYQPFPPDAGQPEHGTRLGRADG